MYYFGFGANTNIKSMAHRCPNAKWTGTATLPGYTLRFRIHADIERNDNARVFGVLWQIDQETLDLLDQYEGYPTYYTRIEAEVWQDGEPIRALVYMMNDQSYEDMPSKDYLKTCTDGYEGSHVPIAQIYEALEHVKSDTHWDPVFNRMKPTDSQLFSRAINKNEYYDLDD